MPFLDHLEPALAKALCQPWVPPARNPGVCVPRPYRDLLATLSDHRPGTRGPHAPAAQGAAASRGVVPPQPARADPRALALQRQAREHNVRLPVVQSLLHKRMQLPVYKRKAEILSAVLSSKCSVTVIGGETGSGKTTQVACMLAIQIICASV